MLCKKVKFEEINPAPYNPKKDLQPGDPEYEKIKASIERFEMSEALVWNKRTGNLIDGHQRLKILKEKGHKEEWCVIKDLSLEEEKALNLALFELKGDYDMTKLAEVLNSLDEDLLQYTGFTMDRVHEIVLDHLPKVDDEPFKPEGGKRGGGDRLKVDWDGFSIWHAEIMAFMYATPTASYLASYTVMDGKDLPQKGPGNRLFVDSGFLAGYRKQGLPYLERQGEIIDYARRNEADWVAMMDIPLVEPILKKLEISREKAYEIHLDKAREFYHASTGAVEFAVRLAIKEWITNNYGADQVLSSKDTGGEEE